MLTISVWPRRLKEFLLTHPLYKSPSAAAATTTPAASAGWTSCRTRVILNAPKPIINAIYVVTRLRRVGDNAPYPMMPRFVVPARRWRRRGCDHRAPRVANDRILHDDRLVRRRLDTRAVAMSADGRTIGMRNHLHAIADRAERTINVTAVDPCPSRHAASRKNKRSSRKNRQIVLVHDPPRFPITESKADKAPKPDRRYRKWSDGRDLNS